MNLLLKITSSIEHLGNLYESFVKAFANDALQEYVRAVCGKLLLGYLWNDPMRYASKGVKRPGPKRHAFEKCVFCLVTRHDLKRRVGYTVGAGDSAVMA